MEACGHGRTLPPPACQSTAAGWRLGVRRSPRLGTGSRTPGGRAERDAGEDHRAARELRWRRTGSPNASAPGGGADQRLEVEERARQLGRDARLPVGEQRERHERAGGGQRDQRQHRRRARGRVREALERRVGERREPAADHLHRGHRDRVAARAAATAGRPRTSPTARRTAARARRRRAWRAPPPPPATIPTPASASAKPSQAAGPVAAAARWRPRPARRAPARRRRSAPRG